jgi:hypothetical protein
MLTQPTGDCLAALNRAARDHTLLSVELRSGESFSDGVCEVFTECGADVVVFHARNCILVEDIVRCAPVAVHDDAVA